MTIQLSRRRFIQHTAAMGGAITLGNIWAGETPASDSETLKPIGQARGIHPGRVVWVHDPEVTNWTGPGDGHWYQGDHTRQERVDAMMVRAVCELTGDGTVSQAWDRLFLHFNRTHAKRELPYQAGEKIVIKPNWVGMIWRGRSVDPDTYTLVGNQDYMNTAPQMILALLRQLVTLWGWPSPISLCVTRWRTLLLSTTRFCTANFRMCNTSTMRVDSIGSRSSLLRSRCTGVVARKTLLRTSCRFVSPRPTI